MLFQIVIILLLLWLLYIRLSYRRKIQCFKQFKNDLPSLPVIGLAHMFIGKGEGKMKAMEALGREAIKQGGVTSLQSWILGHFYAVIGDADAAEVILRNCLEKDDAMKMFQPIFGEGLVISPVPEWRLRRKALIPAFATKSLNQYVNIFRRNSSILVDKIRKLAGTGPFSVYDYITAYSMDSVFDSIYGFGIDAQNNPQHPVLRAFNTCCELVSNRICLPWLHNPTVYEMTTQCATLKTNAGIVFKFVDETILQKCRQIKAVKVNNSENDTNHTQTGPKTVLQRMIESTEGDHHTFAGNYLREETFVVTFAGTDTTSVTMSFVLVLLGRFPDVQEKVYQEIIDVVGDSENIEAKDLPHLKYLEAVIKETLRMYPTAPLLLRKVDKDMVLPSGQYLVSGSGVIINVWAVHHNPLYWPEPETFRPERFLETTLSHPAAFLAFSYGVRNCIGVQFAMMSLKTAIASIVREYRVLPGSEDTKGPLQCQFDVMMRESSNFTIQLVSR